MAYVKFFLDTNALNYLAGLKGSDLEDFKTQIEASNSEISTTHVQVDESTKHIKFHEPVDKEYEKKVRSYQQKIKKALESLKNKGIVVHVKPTKIAVCGVSRSGYAVVANEEVEKLYDELKKEIDECDKARGKNKKPLNPACDAVIAFPL